MVTTELLKELSNDGEKEVKELIIKDGGKTYSAVFVMDFKLYRQAYGMFLDTSINQNSNGKGADVQIKTDILGAGDKILFMGWHSGDEIIKKNMRLRAKAGQLLGNWLMTLSADDEEEQEEKKS